MSNELGKTGTNSIGDLVVARLRTDVRWRDPFIGPDSRACPLRDAVNETVAAEIKEITTGLYHGR